MIILPLRIFAIAAAFAGALFASRVYAARDVSAPVPRTGGYEIVVMEIKGCRYCPLVRSDILPVFQATPRGREIPVRFVDLNADGIEKLKLDGAINTVPTAVLMHGDREVGRIPGYVGPQNFVSMVSAMMLGRH